MTTLIVLPTNDKPFSVPLPNGRNIYDIAHIIQINPNDVRDHSKSPYKVNIRSINEIMHHRLTTVYTNQHNMGCNNINMENTLAKMMPFKITLGKSNGIGIVAMVVPSEVFVELSINPTTLEYNGMRAAEIEAKDRDLAAQEKAKADAVYYTEIKAEALRRLEVEKREADINAMTETLRKTETI
jgi:hypothetical protein